MIIKQVKKERGVKYASPLAPEAEKVGPNDASILLCGEERWMNRLTLQFILNQNSKLSQGHAAYHDYNNHTAWFKLLQVSLTPLPESAEGLEGLLGMAAVAAAAAAAAAPPEYRL